MAKKMFDENQKQKAVMEYSFIAYAIWALSLPYYYVWKLIEWFPYVITQNKKLDNFNDKDIEAMISERINIAYVVFLILMFIVYIILRPMLQSSLYKWFSIFFSGLLALGGNVHRKYQHIVYIEEAKRLGIKYYFGDDEDGSY